MADLGSVRVKFSADLTEFNKGFETVQKSMDSFGKKSKEVGKKLTEIGAAMSGLGLSAAAGLGYAVKSAAGFEKSLSDIKAVSGLAGDEMERIKGLALQMGAETKYSAVEAFSGYLRASKGRCKCIRYP